MGGGPTFQYGDMFQTAWNQPGTLFVVTGNSYINLRGQLVMGRGAAKALSERVHGIARMFGDLVREVPEDYYLLRVPVHTVKECLGHWCRVFCDVGLLQVKRHFRDVGDTALIKEGVTRLASFAKDNPTQAIHMNMPGIGWGRLSERTVLPLLADLPKNVNVWRYSYQAPYTPYCGQGWA